MARGSRTSRRRNAGAAHGPVPFERHYAERCSRAHSRRVPSAFARPTEVRSPWVPVLRLTSWRKQGRPRRAHGPSGAAAHFPPWCSADSRPRRWFQAGSRGSSTSSVSRGTRCRSTGVRTSRRDRLKSVPQPIFEALIVWNCKHRLLSDPACAGPRALGEPGRDGETTVPPEGDALVAGPFRRDRGERPGTFPAPSRPRGEPRLLTPRGCARVRTAPAQGGRRATVEVILPSAQTIYNVYHEILTAAYRDSASARRPSLDWAVYTERGAAGEFEAQLTAASSSRPNRPYPYFIEQGTAAGTERGPYEPGGAAHGSGAAELDQGKRSRSTPDPPDPRGSPRRFRGRGQHWGVPGG